jgi:ParB-like chromosome segregation protein Spo0J
MSVEQLGALAGGPVPDADTAIVAVSDLIAGDSPRLSGESTEHIRRLAESDEPLPPLLVHRATMRIVDGMHRLRAAQLSGQAKVRVRYVDGDEASTFVLAVQANIAHGLPLTLADRKAAAARIIGMFPAWSDRMVASVAGISAKTAAAVRRRHAGNGRPVDARIGRDGRARPVDGTARREAAARLMQERPDFSLREVARAAGISPETARRVRARLRAVGPAQQHAPAPASEQGGQAAIRALRADPAFRANERGRSLLRMLSASLALDDRGGQFVGDIPAHCLPWIAEAALACSAAWRDFAEFVHHRQGDLDQDVSTKMAGPVVGTGR